MAKFAILAAIALPLMVLVALVTLLVIYEVRRMKQIRQNLPREGMGPPGFEVEIKKDQRGGEKR